MFLDQTAIFRHSLGPFTIANQILFRNENEEVERKTTKGDLRPASVV